VQGLKTAGGVLGASEDGTYVYFVANGALSAGAPPGDCDIETEEAFPTRTCDLYVMHLNRAEWEAPHLVAVLSNDDAPDWGGAGFPGDLGWVTSRVSPNGRYLAFMSDRSLTGYDNEDVTSKAPGERRNEEVFLYDAKVDRLACASCNPTGAQPHGVLDPGKEPEPGRETSEGVGLLTDRIGIWGRSDIKAAHWLAGNVPGWTSVSIERAVYQSRYLLDSGRLFFNSPDLLVPAVREPYEAALAAGKPPVSKEKVYEYEPNGVGGCNNEAGCIGVLSSPNGESEPGGERESAFLDASESGNDVFFLTAAKLPEVNGIPQDVDGNFDVYDARMCNQAPSFSCLPAPALGTAPCEGEACKSPAPHAPEFLSPASMTARASGNVAGGGLLPSKEAGKPASIPKSPTRAQLLARALKQCRSKYKKNKHKRASCEARARKRYGHASRHKKSKTASHTSRYHRRSA
jgi:hypothetical protein